MPAQVARAEPGQGFPRCARLTRPREFEQVLRRPDFRTRTGPLRLNAVFTRMHGARLGLVIGKKAVPRAADRNRIKRVIREKFRITRPGLPCADVVIRVVGPVRRSDLHVLLDRLLGELAATNDAELAKNSGSNVHPSST